MTREEAWERYRIALRRYAGKEISYDDLLDAYIDLIGTY